MSELEQNLQRIQAEKNSKIIPDNIRAGVQIFDVVGTVEVMDSTDATAEAGDILSGETAYIKGGKVTGTMPNIGTKTVTPSINSTSTTSVNGYVTSISTPSVKSVIEANSKTNMLAYKAVGGKKTTFITATVTSKTGCKVYAIVVARGTLSIPDRWEMTHSYTVAPYGDEMWYQTMYIYEVLADGETTTFTVTQNVEEILYVTLISFDTAETMDLIYEQNSTATQSTSVNIQGSYQAGDFMFLTYLRSNEEDTDYSDDVLIKRTTSPYAEIETTKYLTEDGYPPLLTAMRINGAASAKYSNLVFSVANECAFCIFRIPSTALRPENIRANIKIMDIVGTLVENPESDIKEFLTTNEMYASTGNKEGDYAIIIDEDNTFIGLYLYENAIWVKQTVNTDDATAAITDIAQGKTAYVKGEKITGTVPVITGTQNDYVPSGSVGRSGSYVYGLAKPAGRTNAQTTMYRAASTLNVILPQADVAAVSGLTADVLKKNVRVLGVTGDYEGTVTTDATATSGDIMEGKTAYVNGQKIVGTVAPITNIESGVAKNVYVPADQLTTLKIDTVITERGILGQNLDYTLSATGDQVTKAIGLSPAILKKGMNILGMEGTFDSNPEAYNAKFETSGRNQGLTPLTMLVAVDKIDTSNVTNASNIFTGCTYLKSLPPMDLNNATSTQYMCSGCYNLMTTPDLTIPNVTDISSMFHGCNNLTSVNLINTDKVAVMTYTFYNCKKLIEIPESINYSNVLHMNYTFANSGLLNAVDLGKLYCNKPTSHRHINCTFLNCNSVTSFENYNAIVNFQNFYQAFWNCSNLVTVKNCNFGNIWYGTYMFANCYNLREFINCNIFLRTYNSYYNAQGGYMFANCYNLTTLPNNFFENLNLGEYAYMFFNCSNLNFPNEVAVNFANGRYGSGFVSMFQGCNQLTDFTFTIKGGYFYNYPNYNTMFAQCANLNSITINNATINNMPSMFHNCFNLKQINFVNLKYGDSYDRIIMMGLFSGTGITSVNNISGLNYAKTNNAYNFFANCYNLYDLGDTMLNFWNVTSFSSFFANCTNLSNITYNQINVNKATSVASMFYGCTKLNTFKDWIFPEVTSAGSMFQNCTNLTTVSNIQMPKVLEMPMMFKDCTSLPYFNDWSFPLVNNTYNMFANCTNLKAVSNLNFVNVKNISNMFADCINLTTVSNINFSNATNVYNLFRNCSNLTSVTNVDLSKVVVTYNMFEGAGNISNFTNLNLINVINAHNMFANSGNVFGFETLNMPKLQNTYYMFRNSKAEVVGDISYPNVICAQYMFSNCHNLKTIGNLCFPNATILSYMVHECPNLETLGAIHADKSNQYSNLIICRSNSVLPYEKLQNFGGFINIGKGYTYKSLNYYMYTINLLQMPNLTQRSIQNVMSNLYNLCTTYNVSSVGALSYKQNIMIYDTQYKLLTTDEITAVKNKGWLFNIINIT